MNRVTIATTLALTIAGISRLPAAGAQAPAPDPKIGTTVTITGCLHKGTSRDSFVLVGVTERAVGAAGEARIVPYAIYWLDSTDGLKSLVGEMVDVTGKVTERRKNPGTIKVSLDPDAPRTTEVEVSSASKALNVTTEKYDETRKPVGASSDSSAVEFSRPVYKLAVDNVHSVNNVPTAGPACH